MSTIQTGDRVMTTDYKVKGIVRTVVPSSARVHIRRSSDEEYDRNTERYIDLRRLLKCSPFWKGWITVVAPLLVICAVVIAFDKDYNTSGVVWVAYAFSTIAAFGARCYQYFVQWR